MWGRSELASPDALPYSAVQGNDGFQVKAQIKREGIGFMKQLIDGQLFHCQITAILFNVCALF